MDGQDLCRSGATVYQDRDGNEIPPPGPDAEIKKDDDVKEETDNDN